MTMDGYDSDRESTHEPIWNRTDSTPPQYRRLDAIARLVNGREPCSAVCFDEIQKRFLVANNGGEVCPLLEPYCQFFKFIVENNVTIAQIENDVDIRQRMDALVQKSLEEKYKEKETRLNTLHEVLRAMNNKEAVDEEFLDAEIEKISQRLRKLNEEKSALPVNEDQLSMRIQQLEQLSNLWKDVNLTKAQSF